MRIKIILALTFALILGACNKEEPKLTLTITPSSTSVQSGEPIDFILEGQSEFLVFYSGVSEQEYSEYPNASARTINMQAAVPTFSHTYSYHGTVTATFIATSYGNWGEDKLEKSTEFTIEIIDNDASLKSVTLKTAGLFGNEFFGVIDEATSIVTVSIPATEDISNLKTNIAANSPRANILFDGISFENNTSLDYSSTGQSFTVDTPGGASVTWQVVVETI